MKQQGENFPIWTPRLVKSGENFVYLPNRKMEKRSMLSFGTISRGDLDLYGELPRL